MCIHNLEKWQKLLNHSTLLTIYLCSKITLTYVCEGIDDVWEGDGVEPAAGQLECAHRVVDAAKHDVDCVKTGWKTFLEQLIQKVMQSKVIDISYNL